MARILSVQSHVAFGHVGHAAAVFPLQTLGHEVWPVPTAVLSNHAGYPDTGGERLSAGTVRDILTGLDARGAFAECDLLLSGYLGAAETGDAVLDALAQVRAHRSSAGLSAVYCCDPVMGDTDTGLYVDDALREFFCERAAPAADVMTPNLFELEVLSGRTPQSLRQVPVTETHAAARDVLARMRAGGRLLVTSVEPDGLASDGVAMAAVDADGMWIVETPRLEFTRAPHGAGDLVSALFAAALAGGQAPAVALAEAASRLFAVLEETARQDVAELCLVESRDRIVSPAKRFEPVAVD